MASTNLAYKGVRREEREDVDYRTVAVVAGGGQLPVQIVNISPNGLMARCEREVVAGARLTFKMPGVAPVVAQVRWALGGRIGCEFSATIPVESYFQLLSRLRG